MSKRNLLSCVLLGFVFLGALGAQVAPTILPFGGINSALPGYTGLHNAAMAVDNTVGIPMANQVAYVTSKLGFAGSAVPRIQSQVVLGYSQGGLRALAYAKDLVTAAKARKVQNPSGPGPGDYLAGLITINSPVQGYFPLAQGLAVIRNKITTHATTLSRGIAALGDAFGTDIPSVVADKAGLDSDAKQALVTMLKSPSLMADAAMERLLAPGIGNATPDPNSALDMARTSSWYQANIRQGITTTADPGRIGVSPPPPPVQVVKTSSFLGCFYYHVYTPPPGGLIPSEVKIAYIYGDNSNFDSFVASNLASNPGDELRMTFVASYARAGVSVASDGAALALKAMAVKLDWDDFWAETADNASFWDDTYHGDFHNQALAKWANAGNAEALSSFVTHIDQVVADSLGSTAHDGFIPVADQFDDLIGTASPASLGGAPIDPLNTKRRVGTNHLDTVWSPQVWGTEGASVVGLGKSVGVSGAVRQYLNSLGIAPGITPQKADWDK